MHFPAQVTAPSHFCHQDLFQLIGRPGQAGQGDPALGTLGKLSGENQRSTTLWENKAEPLLFLCFSQILTTQVSCNLITLGYNKSNTLGFLRTIYSGMWGLHSVSSELSGHQ